MSSEENTPPTLEEQLETYKRIISVTTKANRASQSPQLKLSVGRGVRRNISLFIPLQEMIVDSDLYFLAVTGENDWDEFDGLSPEQVAVVQRDRARNHSSRLEMRRLDRDFEKILLGPDLEAIIADLERQGNDARAHDTRQIREKMALWLNQSLLVHPNPPLTPETRADRGIQHNDIGRLLCPITLNWDDDAVRQKIRDGNDPDYSIGVNFFCRFLYRGFGGDVNEIDKDFLKSNLLVKAYRLFYTSPASAQGILLDQENDSDVTATPGPSRRHRARKDVASLLNMRSVTPRSIAYVAVQVHFALSSAPSWTMQHEGFNYHDFYNFVIDFFETASDPDEKKRTQDLLAWWNRKVFPQSVAASAPTNALSKSMDKLKAARLRRG